MKAGTYNDYSLTDYETLFAQGLIDILNAGCENMSYANPQVITVEIIEDGINITSATAISCRLMLL